MVQQSLYQRRAVPSSHGGKAAKSLGQGRGPRGRDRPYQFASGFPEQVDLLGKPREARVVSARKRESPERKAAARIQNALTDRADLGPTKEIAANRDALRVTHLESANL